MTKNANIVEKNRTRLIRTLVGSQGEKVRRAKPTKDKYGNNMKKHFATFKYFIKKNANSVAPDSANLQAD